MFSLFALTGQGVSQCLEDAEAFSILFASNLANQSTLELNAGLLDKTFKQYMDVRKAHVEKVLDMGNRAGDSSREMGTVAEFTMYGFMWAMFKLFGAFFYKEVLSYNLSNEIKRAQGTS
jgi:hypothetical protein